MFSYFDCGGIGVKNVICYILDVIFSDVIYWYVNWGIGVVYFSVVVYIVSWFEGDGLYDIFVNV